MQILAANKALIKAGVFITTMRKKIVL